MNPPLSPHALFVAILVTLVAWRLYRRVRRLIGRQPVRPARLLVTAIAFPALLAAVGLSGIGDATGVEAIAGGAAAGIALGLVGLRLTRYDVTPEGCFYRPNTLLGVTVSLLLVGRLVYRFGAIHLAAGALDPATMQSFGRSPLTLALFGVVALYYATFAIGVLAWYRHARPQPAPPGASGA